MLHGIRVLDLSRVIAGPYCAALLGDLGADVIKLERPGRGDDLRALRGSGRMSASFAAVNRNKRGIAVDLQKPDGARLAFELARRADVLIENFLPGVAERLGLGYAAVRAGNPAIVYASITGFGQTGPLARKPGYNTIAQGMSGLMALTGMPGHPPTRVGGSVSDVAASYMAFGMINAALVHRFRTGEGQQVDVSLLASSLGLLPDPVAIYFDTGERPKRAGNRNLNLTPAEAFETKDGLLNVVLLNPDQWKRFCGALDDPAMETDPRFATNEARLVHHAEFKARVEQILATAPTAEWVTRLDAATIAAGPVYEFHEVFEDPQVRFLELVTEIDQPGAGRVRILGFPGRASGTPPRIERPAPLLGQHTAEVLGELGLAREEIDQLAAAGVIELGDGRAPMKVGTWRGGTRFTVDEAPDPAPGPGQAVVAVHAAGICGTDVHATQGLFPWTPPLVLGHEYTGVVEDVGRGVSRRLVGRAVACEPSYGCGECAECKEGRISQCPRATRVGGFAERVALPVAALHPLPRGLDPVTAAMTEPAACCLAGLEIFRMPRGASVLVIGGGIMGLLTMVLARRRGAGRLWLSDPLEERRAMARRLGASVVIDPAREDLRERVMALTRGRGADVVAEAVGKPELVAEALTLVRPTGVVQLVGVSPQGSRLPLDLFDVHFREVRIHGAFGRGTAFRRALRLMPTLGVKRLVTARFPLERIEEAFAHATAGRGVKTMITPSAR